MRITLFIIFILQATSVFAADIAQKETPWYQVELVLFKHTSKAGIQSERWSSDSMPFIMDNMIELEKPDRKRKTDELIPYTLIKDKKKLKLLGAYKSIRRSSREKDILYLAWRQPTVNRKNAKAVHIHGGKKYPNDAYSEYQEPSFSTGSGAISAQELIPGNIAGSDTLLGPPPPAIIKQVDGSITISVSRYLHIWTDIVFSQPVRQNFSSDPNAKEFKLIRSHMKQHRRMRSKEIHYLDHPLFGILVLVTPVELQKPEEISEEISSEPVTQDTGKVENKKGTIKQNSGN